jgi:hypothetical protein
MVRRFVSVCDVKVGDVESIGRLMPVAIKATAKSRAMDLIHQGYVQADVSLVCPLCALRFLLLLDRKDREQHRRPGGETSGRCLAFLREKITEDHLYYHENEMFVMP